ncbi:MAG: hypothetical protein JSS60_02310 [Verrucomicrobia bacterium]|nr:hypothetical protein [Verrucomicrobiota bacterium]
MAHDPRYGAKKFKKGWLALGFLCVGAALFHKPLLILGCKAALHQALPQGEGRVLSYDKMQWENGAIAISGLIFKAPGSELMIDRIEFKFSGDPLRLRFSPQVNVIHPQILLSSSKETSAPALPFLYRTRFFQPLWTVKNGVLQLPSSSRFYFSMAPKDYPESIGTLLFSYDPNPEVTPMFSADLSMRDKNLQVGFKLQESDLSRLLPLTALIQSEVHRDWEKAAGEVELEGLISLDSSFAIQEVHFQGSGNKIALFGPKMGVDVSCDEVQSSLSYPIEDAQGFFWDKLKAFISVSNGSCSLSAVQFGSAIGLRGLKGEFSFEPGTEPHLTLSGAIFQEQNQIGFNLSGKGGVQEDSTFWSEMALVSTSQKGNQAQALFSLCSNEGGDLALHMKIDNADFQHIDFLRTAAGLPGQCVEGVAAAEATLLFQSGNCQKASVENCLIENVRWYFPEQKITVHSEQIAGDCCLDLGAGQKFALDALHVKVDGGDYLDPHLHLNGLASVIAFENGALLPSQCKGEWNGLSAEISFLGSQADHFADLKVSGDAKELLSFLSDGMQKIDEALPLDLQVALKMEGGVVSLEGNALVAGEEIKGAASLSTATRSATDLLSGKLPVFRLKEGKLQADRLTEKSYGAFVPLFLAGSSLKGIFQCEALFSSSRMQVKIGGEQLHLSHPLAELALPQLKDRPAQFFYDSQSAQWRGELPLADAQMHYLDLDLTFNNIEGSLKWEANRLKAPSFYAECEGLALRGNMELDLAAGEAGRLTLSTSQIAGDVHGLLAILGKLPSLPHFDIPATGNFSSGEKGFALSIPMGAAEGRAEWSFKGSFDGLSFPVNSATSITEGKCDVVFDSKSQRFTVEKGEGIWELMDGTPFTVQLKKFSTQLSEDSALDFALKVVDGKKEFAHFEGKANRKAAEWEIAFESQATHFGGTRLNITRCKLSDRMRLCSFEMKPILKCQDLHAQASFLQNAGFLPPSFSPQNLKEWQLEGTLQAQLFSDDMEKGFSFHAESRDLKVKGQPWSSFHLRAQRMGEKWLIERLEAGGLSLKGAFVVDAEGLTFPQVEGSWEGMTMKGSGYVKTEKKRFACTLESVKGDLSALSLFPKTSAPLAPKGTFIAGIALAGDFSDPKAPLQLKGEANLFIDLQSPLPIVASSQRPVKFSYALSKGFVCEGIDFQLKHKFTGAYLAELSVGSLNLLQGSDLSLKLMEFSLTPAMIGYAIDAKIVPDSLKELEWEGSLEGGGELQISKAGTAFQGTLKPGRYGFGGKSLQFEQFQLRYEKEIVLLRARTLVEEQPLWASLQVDLSKEPYGILKLFDNPKAEGLKFLVSSQAGKYVLESAQGSCYGLTCSLAKNTKRRIPLASVLTGEIKVDGNSFRALLPKEVREGLQNLKFGSGYQWQGDLVIFHEGKKGYLASGALLGREFEALGYQFRSLEGTLEASSEHIVLSNLKIDDPAGTITIRKVELNKTDGWDLHIPQVLVRQLQPSLLRKIGAEPTTVKPFTIKNFTLTDIRGRLGDKSTLEGSGHLMFVNQFKKESSILDVPLEMIKKIGLDIGLLTPVQGELQMELRGDKFYLVSLDNSFSEGDRAEFYLVPDKDLSYIDLDGKVHIDLKMRQDVVLKITEPFTLTIRGTLDKPRYGLQY